MKNPSPAASSSLFLVLAAATVLATAGCSYESPCDEVLHHDEVRGDLSVVGSERVREMGTRPGYKRVGRTRISPWASPSAREVLPLVNIALQSPNCPDRAPCIFVSTQHERVALRMKLPSSAGTYALRDLAAAVCEETHEGWLDRDCTPVDGALVVRDVEKPCRNESEYLALKGQDFCGVLDADLRIAQAAAKDTDVGDASASGSATLYYWNERIDKACETSGFGSLSGFSP